MLLGALGPAKGVPEWRVLRSPDLNLPGLFETSVFRVGWGAPSLFTRNQQVPPQGGALVKCTLGERSECS